jgi:hypothetical protein
MIAQNSTTSYNKQKIYTKDQGARPSHQRYNHPARLHRTGQPNQLQNQKNRQPASKPISEAAPKTSRMATTRQPNLRQQQASRDPAQEKGKAS